MYDEYWTEDEISALEKVTTFKELSEIGLTIARRMKSEDNVVIQICGPMSTGGFGSLEKNMRLFEQAIRSARQQKLVVFDQTVFQTAMLRLAGNRRTYCTEILEEFYRILFEAKCFDKLLSLPDWETSTGAQFEYDLAIKLGIPFEDFPIGWIIVG